MKVPVVIRKITSPHQTESFKNFRPLSKEMGREIEKTVAEIFDSLGGPSLLKESRRVYIKPNAVDAKAYTHTRVEVLEAVIRYWQAAGADKIYLFENATQANYTRLVFRAAGYTRLCRKTGALPVYLDEESSEVVPFGGKSEAGPGNPEGYDLTECRMPATVMTLIREREKHLYINVPKLKTHSMGVVTLGIKNQWGLPMHVSRGYDHNYNLPHKLVDVLSMIRPDLTLIEGIEGTVNGHFPATALADRVVKPFRILIGSRNIVAADMVGAKVFGLEVKDVPHLQISIDRGLGEGVSSLKDISLQGDITSLKKIDLLGDMPAEGHYSWNLVPEYHDDVRLIIGKELACPEGCVNNPLNGLQIMALDHGGRGGWTMIMGKGFDAGEIASVAGKVFLVGHCAIEELSEKLTARLGKKNVYTSGECNNLKETAEALFHLMKVSPASYIKMNPLLTLKELVTAKIKGSSSRVPSSVSNFFKLV